MSRISVLCLLFLFSRVCLADTISLTSFSTNSVGRGSLESGPTSSARDVNLNPNVGDQGIRIIALKMNNYSTASATSNAAPGEVAPIISAIPQIKVASGESVSITGLPLVYPNPSHWSSGTTLGYELSADASVDVQIYDMSGNQIANMARSATNEGGKLGYNRLKIDSSSLGGYDLPAGVYIYFVLSGGKVLGKGKMAIVP